MTSVINFMKKLSARACLLPLRHVEKVCEMLRLFSWPFLSSGGNLSPGGDPSAAFFCCWELGIGDLSQASAGGVPVGFEHTNPSLVQS